VVQDNDSDKLFESSDVGCLEADGAKDLFFDRISDDEFGDRELQTGIIYLYNRIERQ
jgi:hypothetical protein